MKLEITKRRLHDDEIQLLIAELNKFPHIGFISEKLWNRLGETYVATIDDRFAGVCTAITLNGWMKMGPLVVLSKYHGHGYGKLLLTHTVGAYSGQNIYIGTSNPKVATIARGLRFEQIKRYMALPSPIKMYLLSYLFERLSIRFLLDSWKKKFIKRPTPYLYFLKYQS